MDVLPEFCKARVLILGVGNILFGNDGFGPQVIETILGRYSIPEDIYVMDVGTGVRKLLFTITISDRRPQEIIIIDAVDWGEGNADVFDIPVEDIPTNKIDDFSLHQVPTSNLLKELQDLCGLKITIIGCDVGFIPQKIEPGLSDSVKNAVGIACKQISEKFSFDDLIHQPIESQTLSQA